MTRYQRAMLALAMIESTVTIVLLITERDLFALLSFLGLIVLAALFAWGDE